MLAAGPLPERTGSTSFSSPRFPLTIRDVLRNTSSRAPDAGLREERKALAERYTIDAEEAELRAGRAADSEVRRELEEQALADTDDEEQARREADERARLAAEEQARREERARAEAAAEVAAHTVDVTDELAGGTDPFPIYGWLQRSVPEPTAIPDWPRSLVKTKEEHGPGGIPPA
jgi:hypothetical protein